MCTFCIVIPICLVVFSVLKNTWIGKYDRLSLIAVTSSPPRLLKHAVLDMSGRKVT